MTAHTYDYERGCSHVAVTVIPHEPIAVTEGGALRFGPVLVMPEGNTAAERADWLDDLAGKCVALAAELRQVVSL